jgi:DNA adenine methylase
VETSPIKWMGSKKKLIPWITQYTPQEYNTYFEPFMGSGIMFFNQEPETAICSDLQAEPIVVMNAIKDFPQAFHSLFIEYSKLLWDNGDTYYYKLRAIYNEEKENISPVKRAAMFMVLLRAGFNGLIRFNPRGNWNVPFGDRGWIGSKNQAVKLHQSFPYEKIEEWSNFLNQGDKKFLQQSFKETIDEAIEGDFIYADPPYLITTQQYKVWNISHELKLAEALKNASNRGVKFVLSNVYRYKEKENIQLLDLYSDFKYELKSHSYVVGPNRHKSVEEIIIFN